MNKIICIGGTGQVVLHLFVQMYLLGLVKDPFEAVVIDADDLSQSLQTAQEFFNTLKHGVSDRNNIPNICYVPVRPKGDTVYQALTGLTTYNPQELTSCGAFFSSETLKQNLTKGLFARPALSSLFISETLIHEALIPKSDSKVVLIGSVIGGTGGGLIAPTLDQLQAIIKTKGLKNVVVRAVFFGQYFQPTRGTIDEGDNRFRSNETMVFRSIAEAVQSVIERLNCYFFIGGSGSHLIARDQNKEQIGKNLPWPDKESSPYWEGMQALTHLLQTNIPDVKKDFETSEQTNIPRTPNLIDARNRVKRNFGRIEALTEHKVINSLGNDFVAKLIFGKKLWDLILGFWRIAAEVEGKERVSGFAGLVQSQIEEWWSGRPNYHGIKSLFPLETEIKSTIPSDFKRIAWPIPPNLNHRSQADFQDQDTTARIAAAVVLKYLLKEQD